MSAPDTNLEKQERRHAGPLIGMGAGVLFAGILLVALLTYQTGPVEDGDPEAGAAPAAVVVDE